MHFNNMQNDLRHWRVIHTFGETRMRGGGSVTDGVVFVPKLNQINLNLVNLDETHDKAAVF